MGIKGNLLPESEQSSILSSPMNKGEYRSFLAMGIEVTEVQLHGYPKHCQTTRNIGWR
jgi:hypothetical protein